MSRLIDADELLKELESNKLQPTKDTDGFIDGWCEGFNTVVDMIRNQPTAFDTEKVVEQLEGLKQHNKKLSEGAYLEDDKSFYFCAYTNFAKAIAIVKKGVVE